VWKAEDVLTVPTGALFRKGKEWAVYAVRSGRARTTPVQVGYRNAQRAQILAGISPGDRVVLHPSDRVKEGSAVLER
jgi:HlyD family secretion protein